MGSRVRVPSRPQKLGEIRAFFVFRPIDNWNLSCVAELLVLGYLILVAMKIIFWLAVVLESAALFYCGRKAWLLSRADHHIYPEQYRQVFYPILVLSALVIISLIIKYYFQSDKSATFVALLPVIMLVLALVGVIIGTILVGGKWH